MCSNAKIQFITGILLTKLVVIKRIGSRFILKKFQVYLTLVDRKKMVLSENAFTRKWEARKSNISDDKGSAKIIERITVILYLKILILSLHKSFDMNTSLIKFI